ncbi:MAG: glycosyltransferase [Gallionellaceae bacterium]|nr:glycosyltransferase [Gallionellaceae bacterium]
MRRVLMVSDVYFPRVNGVSTSIETFRQALLPEGVSIGLVAPRYGVEPEQDGVVRLGARAIPRDPEDRLLPWGRTHRTVLEQARAHDLVHIQTPFVAHYAGLRAARRLGKPVLATYHTLFEEYLFHYTPFLPPAWLRGLARRLSRTQCNDLDAVIVPSTAMRDRLDDYGVRVPLHVLPTGIPLDRFAAGDRRRFRAEHGIAGERPVALFVGRVAHEKNIGFLLDAVALARRRQPDLLFLVTGQGPAEAALRRQAEALGIAGQVRFLGYLDRQQHLPDAYAAADLFVFASRTETQGLVLLEAMAMGLPVVALAAMGTRDILAPGRGGVAAPDDVEGFAGVVADLLDDPARRARLAAAAREYAREWADDRMAARLAALYRALA